MIIFWDFNATTPEGNGYQEIAEHLQQELQNITGKVPNISLRINRMLYYFRSQYRWRTDRTKGVVHLYGWSGICYEEVFESPFADVMKRIFSLCGWGDFKIAHAKELLEQLKNSVATEWYFSPPHQINNYPNEIPFKNGIYHIVNHTFEPPNPDKFFTFYINANFTTDMNCPMFRQFITQILPDEINRTRVLTYMCYCLQSAISYGIAQIWTGAGANGKTTLTNILKMIVGMNNSCGKSLGELMSDNRFVKIELKNRLVNFGSEINQNDIDPDGIRNFKANITNLYLSGEFKNKDPEQWINITKHIFDVNELPFPKFEMDHAFYRRIHIIPFVKIVSQSEKILDLDQKIFAAEADQIVAYLLTYSNRFDEILQVDPEETESLWRLNTISVAQFFERYCIIDFDYKIERFRAYQFYLDFCKRNFKKAYSLNTFEAYFTKVLRVSLIKKDFSLSFFTMKCCYEELMITETKPPELDAPTAELSETMQSIQHQRGIQ